MTFAEPSARGPALPLLAALTGEAALPGMRVAGGPVICLVEAAAPGPAPAAGAPLRRWRRLSGPVMALARAVLRRPYARQLALRILKRFPSLYARAYRMMMAPGAAQTAQDTPQAGPQALSPQAAAIHRVLCAQPPARPLRAGGRPRLAFVSPLPPARTGIAHYAAELLAELAGHFDIELVASQSEVNLPPALAGLPVREAAWFAQHGGEYDQVLYQFGNSPFHSHMFALLERYPGVVVLHDFFLGGALAHAQMSGARPRAWGDALLHSHGYAALASSADAAHGAQAHKAWPCSLPVLEAATRVIVHSRHARQLAADWFGPAAARHIDIIPHPRTPPAAIDRAAARAALGIPADCFLVCSFGFVAPNKLTHELLRAWIDSPLHRDPGCALVLVGANHDSPYGVEVEALIRGAGPHANIRITGWADDTLYRQYLQAANAGVQLRTNAHGESSGAVLDCMNYGLATVVNANGSMAEFPPDAVWRLPDAFDVAELGAALEALRRDPARCAALGASAVALLDAHFRPAQCARRYLATLAAARDETQARHAAWRAALADEPDAQTLAARLAGSEPATRRRLLADISDWAEPGAAPDELAASQLRALFDQAGANLRIEPVFLDSENGAPCFRQARNATGRLLGLDWTAQDELVVDVHAGDIYYAFDAASPAVAAAFDAGLFAHWRARGVTVNLLVRGLDDGLLPRAAAGASRLLCTSEAIAQQLAAHSGADTPQGQPG